MKKILKTFYGILMFMITLILLSVLIVLQGIVSVGFTLVDIIEEVVKKNLDPSIYKGLKKYME